MLAEKHREGYMPKELPSIGMAANKGSAVQSRSEGASFPIVASRRGLTTIRREAGKILCKCITFVANGTINLKKNL